MAFQSSDGQKFTNRPPMRQHEKSMMAKKSMAGGAGIAERTDPLEQPAGESDGGEHTPEEAAQTVEEHGPASEVHMTHDHEAGMHHVQTMHPDGHEHHSDHGSMEEAHEHAKHLSQPAGEEQHEEPDGDEPEYE